MAYVEKQNRDKFRDLRCRLESDDHQEVLQHAEMIQEHLRSDLKDLKDHLDAAQAEAKESAKESAKEKDGFEGLGSKKD